MKKIIIFAVGIGLAISLLSFLYKQTVRFTYYCPPNAECALPTELHIRGWPFVEYASDNSESYPDKLVISKGAEVNTKTYTENIANETFGYEDKPLYPLGFLLNSILYGIIIFAGMYIKRIYEDYRH